MTMHPAFAEYLVGLNEAIAQSKAQNIQATPESARAALASLNQFAAAPRPVAEALNTAVTYENDMQQVVTVPVRIYVPVDYARSDSILFVHGGGHMAGDLDVYDWSARRTAEATGMITVSVDYRRSPEAPFPAGLTDTYEVLLQMDALLADFDTTGDIHAVADSGGAAVVSSIAMRTAAGEWHSKISRQVLLYPSVDYTMSGQTIHDFETGYFLEADRIRWYFDHYFDDVADRRAASPMFGPFSAQMPETLVIAAEYDPLLSEAQTYVNHVAAAGSSAQLLVAPGMIHAYLFFETMVPAEVDETYRLIAEFLRTGNSTQPRW